MPDPLFTQAVIAFIWDFDRTLIDGHMQSPIFEAYDVDPNEFWAEVDALPDYHAAQGEVLSRDTAYLLHLLTYVREEQFRGLSNGRLRVLGAELAPAPGMPEFMEAARGRVRDIPEFAREGISVEHYIVSSGIRPMIEGSAYGALVDGIWANSFIGRPARPGFLGQLPVGFGDDVPITALSSVVTDTSKTRAIYEINKGPGVDVNARMADADRRVPLRNMIYVGDGPTDVPVFSLLNAAGGKTLGVFTGGADGNEGVVEEFARQGRIQALAPMDYRPGKPAHDWLMESLEQIGYEIVENRRQAFSTAPPGR